jgi:plasmid stabilization system protein ParE
MVKLVWSQVAADDFQEIVEFIALDKPNAAAGFAKKVVSSVERLVDFPLSGRVIPERASKPYREVIVPPCRVIYLPTMERCEIVRMLRSEQQLREGMLP